MTSDSCIPATFYDKSGVEEVQDTSFALGQGSFQRTHTFDRGSCAS